MNSSWRTISLCLLSTLLAASAVAAEAPLEDDEQRVVIGVRARTSLKGRASDEMPAEFKFSARDFDPQRRIDLASLKVVRWDGTTKSPASEPLPARWYDSAIPYDFLEREQNIHSTDGLTQTSTSRPRWGDFYNIIGDGLEGRLVWRHRQTGPEMTLYAVSFRLLPVGKTPEQFGPREMVGDGSHRCAAVGHSTTSLIHTRIDLFDWDDDGQLDLIVGEARGHLLVYRNRGTKQKPSFPAGTLVIAADGQPVDVGWSSTPKVVDWNQDGLPDLLCGAERNRLVWFRNHGKKGAPLLENQGFVMVDGKPLELPVEPVPKSPAGVFTLDYYPVVETCDWNGDGQFDLLAGGYITGRVYFYENAGTNSDGTPRLKARGPLLVGDQPLNVGDWCAAPCAYDFDRDGDLDLISGNMPITAGGGDSANAQTFLQYYENTGSLREPHLIWKTFPKTGEFPAAPLGTPRAGDLNGDGLIDLAVSANENIFLYFNIGTAAGAPKWSAHAQALPGAGGSAPLPTFGLQAVDWDNDGQTDLLGQFSIFRRLPKGPTEYERLSLLPPGNDIVHPSPGGDHWAYTHLADFDGDKRLDLLWGVHEGYVWLHRNLGGAPPRFDQAGIRLSLDDGQPLRVGIPPADGFAFDVLQGARTTIAVADFNADGLQDLLVGDTYGKLRSFQNTGTRTAPMFAVGVELADQKIRTVPAAADWDGDGRIDALGSAANGQLVWMKNLGGKFGPATPLPMPNVPYSPAATVADWNSDGDSDLVVGTAYGYFCWFDRSFLDDGYAEAVPVP